VVWRSSYDHRVPRRQLLVATLVAAAFLVQVVAVWPGLGSRELRVLAVIAVVCVAAVFARYHVIATIAATAAVLVTTILVTGPGRAFLLDTPGVDSTRGLDAGPLNLAEAAALVALVVVLAWTAQPSTAALCIEVLFVVTLHAAWVRPGLTYPSPYATAAVIVVTTVIAVGAGVLLRMRDRAKAALAEAIEERVRREERLDMARELHDVVAHHVTGMLVRAQAAQVVSDGDKDTACAMLPGIVDGGTEALGAMRAMVRTLRDNAASTATTDLTADLHALVGNSGLPVRTTIELPADVRPELGRSVLRLVQEALTNSRKHAVDATSVEVDVRLTATAIMLSVVDNGTTRPAHSGGFGLVGMRERVSELGGRFFAGATGDGWLVTAELPLAVRA